MNDSLPTSSGPAPSGVSRRTIVKGAAWAVPVVTLAGAAPAFAGASQCRPEPVLTDETCKRAGLNQDYKLVFGIVGDDCGACNLTVDSIRESTGQNVELYGGPSVSQGAAIYICNTNNMSAFVEVYGTIFCGTDKYQGPETSQYGSFWLVKTPNFQSKGNQCTSWGDGCGANTTEQSTLQSTEETAPEAVQKSAPLDAPAEAPAAPAETEVVEPVIEAPATEAVAPPAEETVTP